VALPLSLQGKADWWPHGRIRRRKPSASAAGKQGARRQLPNCGPARPRSPAWPGRRAYGAIPDRRLRLEPVSSELVAPASSAFSGWSRRAFVLALSPVIHARDRGGDEQRV